MTTPVLNFGDYTVCFEAEEEDRSARHHFIKECGWTELQFRLVKNFSFFSAKVSIWKDGAELAADYLGACCYKTEAEFYTRYRADSFSDMVSRCADEINDPTLSELAAKWVAGARKEQERQQERNRRAREKRAGASHAL